MIVSGLLWDIYKAIGRVEADRILGGALAYDLHDHPNFSELGAAILAEAQFWGYECQVRPLLFAREFPASPPEVPRRRPNSASPPRCRTVARFTRPG